MHGGLYYLTQRNFPRQSGNLGHGANIYALFPEYAIPLTSLLQGIQMDPYGLFKIGESFLNGVSTAGGAQLLAYGYEQVSLFFDHFRQYNDALFLGLFRTFHLSAL